ncbi:MAG: sulfite exporter TauE/SafE family protein [Chloroflexi bacterium]|nr:sulfite exporter TauE/SafE family protein [Chloroflexota bacterium]
MLQLLAAAAFALLAMIVRGLTGFGAALVMTPLLLLVFDPKLAIVSAAIVQAVIGLTLLYQVRRQVSRDHLKLLLPPSLIGIIAGAVVLVQFDSTLLKRGLGIVVMLFALRQIFALRGAQAERTRWPRPWGYLAAVISGMLGALFGTSGPPIVIFLENQIDSGVVLRATLIAYFAAVDTVRVGGYVIGNLITTQALQTAAVMLPAAFVGSWLGTRLHVGMNERVFRLVISGLLFATGALLAVG